MDLATLGAAPAPFDELSGTGSLASGVVSTYTVDSVWQCRRAAVVPAAEVLRRLHALNKSAPATKPRTNPRLRGLLLPHVFQHFSTLDGLARENRMSGVDSVLLHLVVTAAEAVMTGETGFASGVSAISMMSALGRTATHVAIDPFQGAFSFAGVRGVAEYRRRRGDQAPAFVHLNETASFGLAWLAKRRVCFDVFLMDDGHKFDDNIVELYTVSKLLSVGGVLLLHDAWLPSVRKTVAYIKASLPFLQPLPRRAMPGTMQLYVKVGLDERPWNSFSDF